MTIKQKALAHYDRMIRWASKQNPRGKVFSDIMKDAIGEIWSSMDCSYCNKYGDNDCEKCPLSNEKNGLCCDGLYRKMFFSKSWKTWIKRAKEVRKYIKENG